MTWRRCSRSPTASPSSSTAASSRPARRRRCARTPRSAPPTSARKPREARMLTVSHLQSAYGDSQVLFDVSFTVGSGEVVTLLGRNGMGKTTTVSSIMGLVRPRGGEVAFDGRRVDGLPPYCIAQCGIGLVPEGRQVFPTLTVDENLVATAAVRNPPARWTRERVHELFPRLAERRGHLGSQLSGGEQQMLAIGR